ncbi:MAG: ABC transporter substrate-binding protein, partial [Paracoccaceae bacterium]
LYCCSGAMIDDLVAGDMAVAYNVLGSYAAARVDRQEALEIVLPADFPTTMMRTALVSKATQEPLVARDFVEHLFAAQSGETGSFGALPALQVSRGEAQRANIALEPALLTFLDDLKRAKFLSEWEAALIQER